VAGGAFTSLDPQRCLALDWLFFDWMPKKIKRLDLDPADAAKSPCRMNYSIDEQMLHGTDGSKLGNHVVAKIVVLYRILAINNRLGRTQAVGDSIF
jgi:hypothetical protein